MNDYTRWLNLSGQSMDESVFAELYTELKKIARSRMGHEREGHTLQATALVNEAWMRLEKSSPGKWENRQQFFGIATEAMRRILVESARRRLSQKRGEGDSAIPLDEIEMPLSSTLPDERFLEIHEVVDQLEAVNPLDAAVVKLRFFGGMTHTEIAAILDVSEMTARRHWASAKVWLFRKLGEE